MSELAADFADKRGYKMNVILSA